MIAGRLKCKNIFPIREPRPTQIKTSRVIPLIEAGIRLLFHKALTADTIDFTSLKTMNCRGEATVNFESKCPFFLQQSPMNQTNPPFGMAYKLLFI